MNTQTEEFILGIHRYEMVEESSRKKPSNSKHGKSFKDVNRDLRAKLANINKNLLSIGNKEKKSQSMRECISSTVNNSNCNLICF